MVARQKPTSRPDIVGLDMPPHIFRSTKFRVPPKVQTGPDGQSRFVPEVEEQETTECITEGLVYSPTTSSHSSSSSMFPVDYEALSVCPVALPINQSQYLEVQCENAPNLLGSPGPSGPPGDNAPPTDILPGEPAENQLDKAWENERGNLERQSKSSMVIATFTSTASSVVSTAFAENTATQAAKELAVISGITFFGLNVIMYFSVLAMSRKRGRDHMQALREPRTSLRYCTVRARTAVPTFWAVLTASLVIVMFMSAVWAGNMDSNPSQLLPRIFSLCGVTSLIVYLGCWII